MSARDAAAWEELRELLFQSSYTNENGQTYGAYFFRPDLSRCTSTEGNEGYVYTKELEDKGKGAQAVINVYGSDGKTVIGTFRR